MQWTTDELLAAVKGKPSPSAFRQFMDDLRSPKNKRSYLFPVSRNQETKSLEPALPGFMLDMLEAAAAPGEVYRNPALMINPETGRTSDYAIGRSADLAGMMTLGSGAIPAEANSLRAGLKPAIYWDNQTWTGKTHLDAIKAMPDKLRERTQFYADRGFVTDRGKYLDRYQAQKYAIKHNLIKPDAPEWAYTSPELISEMLAPPPAPKGIKAYHGSPHDFDQFKYGTGKTAKDIYLTPIKEHAQSYGKNVYEVDVSGSIGDFTPLNRTAKETQILKEAYEGGLSDYFESFDEFVDAFDNGDMYQRFASQHAQNDTIGNLLYDGDGNRRFDAVKIPDAGFGGQMSESIVTDNPKILEIVKKYGVAALVSAGVLSQSDAEALAAQGYE